MPCPEMWKKPYSRLAALRLRAIVSSLADATADALELPDTSGAMSITGSARVPLVLMRLTASGRRRRAQGYMRNMLARRGVGAARAAPAPAARLGWDVGMAWPPL